MINDLNWKRIAEIGGGVLFVALVVWFFFFRSSSGLAPTDTATQQTFGQADAVSGAPAATVDDSNTAASIQSPVSKQKVFKISDGPVAGAAFMQEPRPTTTVARFVVQQSGHVLDLAIDSPGSVAHAISNTTIPGASQVVWEMQSDASRQVAAGAILQYLDNGVTKTVILSFPATTTDTSAAPVRIQFLPNDLQSVAASPDGSSIVYLAATAGGSDGYTARADGTGAKKLFSLPLSQVLLSWPSAGTILAVSKAAAGVPGIAFSINSGSGTVAPLLYANGLTATADPSFSQVVYQSVTAQSRQTYTHNTATNLDRPLSFDPMPEKCIWSRVEQGLMYCAVPLSYTAPGFIDLWHQGAVSAADSVVAYHLTTGQTTVIASPGGTDGGVASDIMQMSLSSDEKYLLFVSKGTRSLWGVKL